MSDKVEIVVPDLGTDEKVEVVEILVAAGEAIEKEDGLITLESDKATMDVPATEGGTVEKILVKVGDRVGTGDPIATLTPAGAAEDPPDGERERRGDEGGAQGDPGEAAEEPEPAAASEGGGGEPVGGPREVAAAAAGAGGRDAEVLVLGSGPGGYTAAFRAADLGRKVVLVERYPTLGGVCLNVGCIPSKALLHVARVIDEAADLAEHGVEFGDPQIDRAKLRSWKDSVVGKLTGGLSTMAGKRGVEVVQGVGRFSGPHELTVVSADGSRKLSFDAAIVAVGSRVVEIPGIPYDDPRVMDSTGALELPDDAKRLLVVGGGIIGLEMANVYAALGAEITVVELLPGLMPGCDRDLVQPLERRLKKRFGVTVHTGTRVTRVEAEERALVAHLEGEGAPETAEFDRILVAVGRRPNGDRIDVEAAGVKADDRGFLPVDRQQRTNVPHIFAIGDVVGQPMLAHKATHQGKVAAEAACGEKSGFDARVIPSVAYTDPEIAWVGLTETEARESGTPYEKGVFPWGASGRALAMGAAEGKTKLLFDPESRRIVGAGIVGPNAGDLIAEAALAIEMDCEAADIGLTIHPHPTLSETVAMAAEAWEGTITDLYLPKKKGK
ncbi:MAG: dihydrolipoyl dehydrogenase [Thermoanaerobaculia bacterium]|nr:dihydrolipoyl dehydrogenase [Thermoanaerobaculia bacterium]